jgi:hypothetical protein
LLGERGVRRAARSRSTSCSFESTFVKRVAQGLHQLGDRLLPHVEIRDRALLELSSFFFREREEARVVLGEEIRGDRGEAVFQSVARLLQHRELLRAVSLFGFQRRAQRGLRLLRRRQAGRAAASEAVGRRQGSLQIGRAALGRDRPCHRRRRDRPSSASRISEGHHVRSLGERIANLKAVSSQIAWISRSRERQRYSRHLLLPEVGEEGQRRLKAARVLCVGAGGLGLAAALYLAAAGVGTIGLVDFDVVDFSNLQRQIIHGTPDVGRSKLESAQSRIDAMNPEVASRRSTRRLVATRRRWSRRST